MSFCHVCMRLAMDQLCRCGKIHVFCHQFRFNCLPNFQLSGYAWVRVSIQHQSGMWLGLVASALNQWCHGSGCRGALVRQVDIPKPGLDYATMGLNIVGVVSKLCKEEQLHVALQAVDEWNKKGSSIGRDVILCLLHACTKKKDMEAGRMVYTLMVANKLESISYLVDHLIRLFAMCENLLEANYMFLRVMKPSKYTWTAIISAHVKLGEAWEALSFFARMQLEGVDPDKVTYLCVLKACGIVGSAMQGNLTHAQLVRCGLESDMAVGNTLIDMHFKCGSQEDAQRAFDMLSKPDAVSWGAIIVGYIQHGQAPTALRLFDKMQDEGVIPSCMTFMHVLKECGSVKLLDKGRKIHSYLKECSLELDTDLSNILINMYAKSGSLNEAHHVFDGMQNTNVVSWNAMITAFLQHNQALCALQYFDKMQAKGVAPSNVTFSCILNACGMLESIEHVNFVYNQIVWCGMPIEVALGNVLIDVYCKCGGMHEALSVFTELSERDVVSWGSILSGYVQLGHSHVALALYEKMQQDGPKPNGIIFSCVLKACESVGALDQGRHVHEQIKSFGFESDIVVQGTLVGMYASCGSLQEAREVFDIMKERDLVSWGAMIAAYANHEQGHLGLELLQEMQDEGLAPNKVIFLGSLKACISTKDVQHSHHIHGHITFAGFDSDVTVGNTLIDVYAKLGRLNEAFHVLNMLSERDVVSWGAIIGGCVSHDDSFLAFHFYERLHREGLEPNGIILYSMVKACTSVGSIAQGRLIHDQICQSGPIVNVLGSGSNMDVLGNYIVEMYAKCGSPYEAHKVLGSLSQRDVVSWSAVISAYVLEGKCHVAEQCFSEMKLEGLKPDEIVFTSLLASCSHAGLLDKACKYLAAMKEDHGVEPSVEHYNCIADLHARAGNLGEAEDILKTMPRACNFAGWMSLLSSARTYNNQDIGKDCFEEITQIKSNDASAYVLMSDIFANAHLWSDAGKMHLLRKRTLAHKKPGTAWIDVNKEIHEFIVGGLGNDKMDFTAEVLNSTIKGEGYVPQLD